MAGLCRSIPLSLRSYDRYPSINSLTFVMGDNIFDVTKGKSKDYYTQVTREKAKLPNIIQSCRKNFILTATIWNKFLRGHTLSLSSRIAKAFHYKLINSILYTNTELYKIGFRTNDLCTFCDNLPELLTHLVYHVLNSFGFSA